MIYTNSDGGARGNPGPGAIGVIVRDGETILSKYSGEVGKFVTNNIAEYEALIKALELASNITDDELTCFLDSELVVKQMNSEYKIKNEQLGSLLIKIRNLIIERDLEVAFKHIPREKNHHADRLVNLAIDRAYK